MARNRRYRKVKRNKPRKSTLRRLDPVCQGVSYRKDVLVQNPRNQYLNQRFGISLFDEVRPGETFTTAYARLREEAHAMLVIDIGQYLNGADGDLDHFRSNTYTVDRVRRMYHL